MIAEQILKKHSNICIDDWEGVINAMNEYANFKLSEREKDIGCKCNIEEKHGYTTIKCCNHCGRPEEDFWINQSTH